MMLQSRLAQHLSIFLPTISLTLSLMACSSDTKVSGAPTAVGNLPQSASSNNSGADSKSSDKTAKDKPAADAGTKPDVKTPAPAVKLTDSEIIAKMVWAPIMTNVSTGKLFTGFGGGQNFAFTMALPIVANGDIPEDIAKTLAEPDFERIYTSAEYKQKAYSFRSKLAISMDATFFASEELPADQVDPEDPMSPIRVYFATSLKAGNTTIDVTMDGKKLSVPVTVTAYTAQQLADGRARYNAAVAEATPSPSCQSCHGAQGGANHSPTYLAQFADASILSTIENGTNPEDGYKTSIAHKMTFTTPAQRAGIVAYLRSLPPMP